VAVTLAQRYPVELISVDAAQVYRGLDVGTAKPGKDLQARVPHGLIDVCEPSDTFSVADYCATAEVLIGKAHAKGRIPLLVGGSSFYFSMLENGLGALPAADPAFRAKLTYKAKRVGWPVLHQELDALDPASAARIERHDAQRIQRALEINRLTGEPVPRGSPGGGIGSAMALTKMALAYTDRAALHRILAVRFKTMLDEGLVAEVEGLRRLPGVKKDCVAMRSVGYRQVWRYLDGEIDCAAMCAEAIAATRQLAKRQLTWLRRSGGMVWFSANEPRVSEVVATYTQVKLSPWLNN
jgi:tRNA dimethylallyltransferase